jgi:hypothetical protein
MSSTPSAPHPVTQHLRNASDEVIGEFAARLVLPLRNLDDDAPADLGAWAITHQLGGLANGTYTAVAFVDDTTADLPESTVGNLVRQIAADLYGRGWAFDYRPEQVADSVLRYGTRLRERVEVSAVEVWQQ